MKSAYLLRAWPVFLLGVVLGMLFWGLSPTLTGKVEPWDSSTPYYWCGLFVIGLISACAGPRQFWAAPCGIFVGQILYMLWRLPLSPFVLLGVGATAVFCVIALAGAMATYIVHWWMVGS